MARTMAKSTKSEAELRASAEYVKGARTRLGLSPVGLATKLKVTPAIVTGWEQAILAPSADHLRVIQRLERAYQRYLTGN